MAGGKVKFYNKERGFGFIIPDDGAPDVFCHVTDLRRTGLDVLLEDQRVRFDVAPGRGEKFKAVNVTLVQ